MERSKDENEHIRKVIEQTQKMRAVSKELKAIAKEIVKKSKETAKVDTGRLKRSISYVVNLDGIITFSEADYGQLDGNSKLLENIKIMFPENEPYIYCTQSKDGKQTVVFSKTVDKIETKRVIENKMNIESKGESFITRIKNMFR